MSTKKASESKTTKKAPSAKAGAPTKGYQAKEGQGCEGKEALGHRRGQVRDGAAIIASFTPFRSDADTRGSPEELCAAWRL